MFVNTEAGGYATTQEELLLSRAKELQSKKNMEDVNTELYLLHIEGSTPLYIVVH